MENANCHSRDLTEEEKIDRKKVFERIPECMLIDILESFLIDGEYSRRNDIIYKKADGKIIKIKNEIV
jgi:hypothetical protein